MAVLQYSDRAVILDIGEISFSGSAAEVRDKKQLREQPCSLRIYSSTEQIR